MYCMEYTVAVPNASWCFLILCWILSNTSTLRQYDKLATLTSALPFLVVKDFDTSFCACLWCTLALGSATKDSGVPSSMQWS